MKTISSVYRSTYMKKLKNLQFDKDAAFNIHQSFVHGKNNKINEVLNNEIPEKDPLALVEADNHIKNPEHLVSESLKRQVSTKNDSKKQFKCPLCKNSFSRLSSVEVHIASVHDGKKPFKCSSCDRCFFQSRDLKQHIASIHEGKKPFKCSSCDKCFSQSSTLK